MRPFSTLLLVAALAGCMQTGPSQETLSATNDAFAACKAQNTKAVARAVCANGVVDRYLRPGNPNPDLVDLLAAKRIALAEKVDAGTMTEADATAAFAQAKADATSEARRRQASASIADAQQRAALQASLPHSCYSLGDFTSCY